MERRSRGERSGFQGRGGEGTAARRTRGSSSSSRWSPASNSGTWRSSPRQADLPPKKYRGDGGEGSSDRESRDRELESSDGCTPFVGTCPDMCPAKERIQRERLRDLSVFERLGGNPGRTSSSLAVKKFCRTISSTHIQTSEVRPLPVLQETLQYLLSLLHSLEHPFEVVHAFVFDRTRSIRQDISMQRIVNNQAIHMYEEMVKFHIVSCQKLLTCNDKSSISSLVHLNMEQLTKVLMSLYDLYSSKQRSEKISKKEAEFYSFYVLLHLGHNNQTTGDSLSLWFQKLAFPILQSKEVRFALNILRYFEMGNYVRFFSTLATDASFLQLCLVEPVVNELRARSILYINTSSYKVHPYPLAHLSKLLMLKESDLESICNACGLKTTIDEAHGKLLPTKQMDFCLPKEGFQHFSFLGSERLQRWQAILNDASNLLDENALD